MDLGIPLVSALVFVQVVRPHFPREHLQDLGEGGGMIGNWAGIVQGDSLPTPPLTWRSLAKMAVA